MNSLMVVEAPTSNVNNVNNGSNNSFDEKKREFLERLGNFLSSCGKRPTGKPPIMGYKELDLYSLYNEVVENGGYHNVVRNVGTWSKIWKKLPNYDSSITDSSYRLKKNYERFLLDFEYHCNPQHKEEATHFQRQNYDRHSDFLFEIITPSRNAKRRAEQVAHLDEDIEPLDASDPEFKPSGYSSSHYKKAKHSHHNNNYYNQVHEEQIQKQQKIQHQEDEGEGGGLYYENSKRSRRYSLCTQEELSAVYLLHSLKNSYLDSSLRYTETVTC